MGDDVIRDDKIREGAAADQLFGAMRPEEVVNRRYAGGSGSSDGPVSRVDAEAADAARGQVAQQISVIAGNFNHQAFSAEIMLTNQSLDVIGRMPQQGRR